MLDITLATEFVPGTNIKGEVAGANWLFLLPELDLKRVVSFGLLGGAPLAALARTIGEVIILADDQMPNQGEAFIRNRHLENVRVLPNMRALKDASVDLALIADSRQLAQFGQDTVALNELKRILKPDGIIYLEQPGLITGKRDQTAINRLSAAFGTAKRFWLTPNSGEMHTAVVDQDQATTAYFLRYGLTSRSVNLAMLKQAVRARTQDAIPAHRTKGITARPASGQPTSAAPRRGLKGRFKRAARKTLVSLYNEMQRALDSAEQSINGSPMLGELTRRYGLLLCRDAGERAGGPPRYLREIAQAAGSNIDRHRWGLSARGEYSSRKVLVFLFDQSSDTPEYIVKMTRDPALNPRLENEYRALKLLADKGIGDRETLPQVAFFGHHNHLAIVGETIVDGIPFEQRSNGVPDCPYMRSAADWLMDMSVVTVDWKAATPAQAAAVLEELYQRFVRIYPLSGEHQRFLTELIATMGHSTNAFPLVFQHGDPGTWNIWVTPSGRAAFLDWEAAEAYGMPLWDLFYFIRTYGAWSARAAISGDVTKGFGEQFLAASPFRDLLVERTMRYCDLLGLPVEFIEPLFYTCWMHRGLKEATRLTASTLSRGHYFNVLCASIDQREALQPLFSQIGSVTRSM